MSRKRKKKITSFYGVINQGGHNMNYTENFLNWAKDKYFKINRLKTYFTPHEQAMKYVDESIYEEVTEGGVIIDAIQISDSDMLVGVKTYWEDVDENTHKYFLQFGECIYYYKLSEITLIDITATEDYSGWEKRWTKSEENNNVYV